MANVGPSTRILVLENCGGMVTGAVAERLGGHGVVCTTYLGSRPSSIDVVRSFNFTKEVSETIKQAPLIELLQMRQRQLREAEKTKTTMGADLATAAENDATVEVAPKETEAEQAQLMDTADEGGVGNISAVPTIAEATVSLKAVQGNTETEKEEIPRTTTFSPINSYGGPPFSGCIIAGSAIHPSTALHAVFPLLAPSASFAVASLHLQPLADAMYALKTSGAAVGMTVQEPWYREQQVLPGRTHPTMSMNHGGGYLLCGTVTQVGRNLPLMLPTPNLNGDN